MENKKVAIIVSFRDFRDPEYFIPKDILEKHDIEIKTASNKKGIAIGAEGGDTEVDLLISEVKGGDFDAIIFIGGPGCLKSLDNEQSYRITREAVSSGKILASICISPVILAKSGVLKGKKAVVWSSQLNRNPVKILEENGAIYEENPVVIDGNIITGSGPESAKEFGEKIVELLTRNN
jgi:protease I